MKRATQNFILTPGKFARLSIKQPIPCSPNLRGYAEKVNTRHTRLYELKSVGPIMLSI